MVTETSGGSPDVDGYAVTVDAGADQVIAARGTLTVTGLVVGEHRIALGGVAAHCRVSGENPRVAQLDIVETTRVTFAVACPGPGWVAVAANTTGQQLDLDGYTVALDGGSESALPSGGSVTLEAVPPGRHAVALGGIASNCAVSGTNPVTVAVQGDAIAAVTFQVSCSGEPGPGAGELLFTSNRSGATHLYRIRRDGTGLVDLTPAVSGSGGRWAPDGSRILFSSVRDGNAELFVMDADGTNLRRLTRTPEGEIHAVWSPDGSRIATSADGDIRLLNADGSGGVVLGPGTRPSWSPDGTRIAFAGSIPISAIRSPASWPPTSMSRRWTDPASPHSPVPPMSFSTTPLGLVAGRHPDRLLEAGAGNVILTVVNSIVAIPARGGLPVPLGANDVVRSTPVWSPDGQSIAFAHNGAGPGAALRVVTLAGGRPRT